MSEITHYDTMQPYQEDLPVLAELAGLPADPKVYKIIIALLGMNVAPNTIYKLMRLIRKTSKLVHSTHASKTKVEINTIDSISEVANT